MVMMPLVEMLRGMEPNPAYALDPKWNIVAWNSAAEMIFGDLETVPDRLRNYLNLVFTSPVLRERFVNWEDVARCSIAHFRTDSAAHVNDPEWMRMVGEVKRHSDGGAASRCCTSVGRNRKEIWVSRIGH
jgi:hypothetical protein